MGDAGNGRAGGAEGDNLPGGAKDVILLGENDDGKNAKAVAKAAAELSQKGMRVRVAIRRRVSKTSTTW